MRFDELNENNYMLFAIKFYNNPHALTKEDFEDDLKRIKYVKRLLKRYKNTGVLKTHLILNHLTVLFNVFDEASIPLLFYTIIIFRNTMNMALRVFWYSIKEYQKTFNRWPKILF